MRFAQLRSISNPCLQHRRMLRHKPWESNGEVFIGDLEQSFLVGCCHNACPHECLSAFGQVAAVRCYFPMNFPQGLGGMFST